MPAKTRNKTPARVLFKMLSKAQYTDAASYIVEQGIGLPQRRGLIAAACLALEVACAVECLTDVENARILLEALRIERDGK